jgi:hypothetical protein
MVFELNRDAEMEALGRTIPLEYIEAVERVLADFNRLAMSGQNPKSLDSNAMLVNAVVPLISREQRTGFLRDLPSWIEYRIEQEGRAINVQKRLTPFFNQNNLQELVNTVPGIEDKLKESGLHLQAGAIRLLLMSSSPSSIYTHVYSREADRMLIQRVTWNDFIFETAQEAKAPRPKLKVLIPPVIETEEEYRFDGDMRRLALRAVQRKSESLILINSPVRIIPILKAYKLSTAYGPVLFSLGCSYKGGKKVK